MQNVLKFAAQGLMVAFTIALVTVPLCMLVARRLNIVDKPGGRKQHEQVTPLLGGVGVTLAAGLGLWVINRYAASAAGFDLKLGETFWVLVAAAIMFVTGVFDDLFKDRMAFHTKLLGQVAGVLMLMGPHLWRLMTEGGPIEAWIYQLFFLCWYLTIINSFNFSDNMNGLMAGLSVIAFSASLFYLGHQYSVRSLSFAALLVGALLGFLPYNFPRSRVFLGDAGSMFVGFWMAWIQFDLSKGFFSGGLNAPGLSNLIPAVLIMSVPLYDAAFVVLMRVVDKRPIYLGDNYHLSHRLVRAGFTPVEAVVLLWGLGIILASVGVVAGFSTSPYRWLLLVLSLVFMIAVTRVIMLYERRALLRKPASESAG
ncbi:MAG: glycosyltransferase family 4 protein [Planctomycetota bacterium]